MSPLSASQPPVAPAPIDASDRGEMAASAEFRKQEIDFEDMEISGELVGPEGEWLEEYEEEEPMEVDEVYAEGRSTRGPKTAAPKPKPGPSRDAKPAPPPPPPMAEPSPTPRPTRVETSSAEMVMVYRKKPGIRMPQVSLGMKKMAEAPPEPEEEPVTIEIGGSFDAPLDVKATTVSVVLPARGETTRYQQLLLPAGQAPEVIIRAKRTKRRGT